MVTAQTKALLWINNQRMYAFSHKKEDMILAGSIGVNELQFFERDIIYTPTWTIKNVPEGIFAFDIL